MLVADGCSRLIAVGPLEEWRDANRRDEEPDLGEVAVDSGQRAQERAAVEPVVVELRGQRSGADRQGDERVGVVGVIGLLFVEGAGDWRHPLLAQVRAGVGEADFRVAPGYLYAAGIAEVVVRAGVACTLKRADPVLHMLLHQVAARLKAGVAAGR